VRAGDVIVLNDTKVLPSRVRFRRAPAVPPRCCCSNRATTRASDVWE
jgi:S-adenosylmethionine:tRNA-ribosyltransferase-isomerase (queuine synthetase)